MDLTTRNQSWAPVSAEASPTTPSKSEDGIFHFYATFNRDLDLDLPIPSADELRSPGDVPKSTQHDIIKYINILYFQDRRVLYNIHAELLASAPTRQSQDDKRHLVLDKLEKASQATVEGIRRTPRSLIARSPLSRQLHPNDEALWEQEDPPSPSLAANRVVKDVPGAAISINGLAPELHEGLTAVNTSFANVSCANTSFANTSFSRISPGASFMSEISHGSQSTVATTVDDFEDAPTTQTSQLPFHLSRTAADLDKTDATASSEGSSACDEVDAALGTPDDATDNVSAEELRNANEASPRKSVAERSANCPSGPPENYRVANIPRDGLAPFDLPESFHSLPPDLAAEAYRVMRACRLSPLEFESQWQSQQSFSSLYSLLEKNGISSQFERGCKTDYNGRTLCAKLRYSLRAKDPFFDLDLLPPREENSNSFQRKFGGHRILSVDLPDLTQLPDGLKGQEEHVLHRVLEMFTKEQQFLGKRWVQFLVQVHKKKDRISDLEPASNGIYQVLFFAVGGKGVEDISVANLMNWAVPITSNMTQPACKAYARLDLSASRTRPSIVFEPDQLKFDVQDQMSTEMPDDDSHNDPQLPFPGPPSSEQKVMNDGCSMISAGAMQRIKKMFHLDYVPSAVQGRIFGAKGVWYISSDDSVDGLSSDDIWIKISPSQIKAKHAREDMLDDEELRTLNIVKWSHQARCSQLYPDFLRILRDRGVPEQDILKIVQSQINFDRCEFLEALGNRTCLHSWVHSQMDFTERRRRQGIQAVAGFPNTSSERVVTLLESGFEPKECAFLKNETLVIAKFAFNLKAKQFKIRLGQSTMLIGICDPTGLLKPGEIHLCFRRPLVNPTTGETWAMPYGSSVLISRNPSRRNSDIQKARVVFLPGLAHLQDIVVFSAQGPRPLASKLSGGDYDGDTFWVCWEKTLVQNFRNAPAPWELEDLQRFGLTQDKVLLRDIVNHEKTGRELDDDVRKWIGRSTATRMSPEWVGRVSNLHVALTYKEGTISSERARLLVDLHDLVIDADKQGYRYTEEAFDKFKRDVGIPKDLPRPAHYKFTGRGGDTISKSKLSRPKDDDIVDKLYFNLVEPEIEKAVTGAKEKMKEAGTKDPDLDLTALYDDISASTSDIIQQELRSLTTALRDVSRTWSKGMCNYFARGRKPSDWKETVQRCRAEYLRIEPVDRSNATVVEWLRRRGKAPTLWDELKASALAKFHTKGDGGFIFNSAGAELCRIKAQASSPIRILKQDVYTLMRPQKRKAETELDNLGLEPQFSKEEEEEGYNDEDDGHNYDEYDPSDDSDDEFDVDESLFESINPGLSNRRSLAKKHKPNWMEERPQGQPPANDHFFLRSVSAARNWLNRITEVTARQSS